MMMEQLVKHLAVRLWTTAVVGSVAVLMVLHPFAGAMGPQWMVLPGVGLLALVFWLVGAVFAGMGRRRLAVLLKEAAVWDRAGMAREAGQALDRAAAIVDSFLFSPVSRRGPAGRLLAKTARFQMAQGTLEPSSDDVIGAYLEHFPDDRLAAVKWLDGVLAGRTVTPRSHDIAARIGAAFPDDTAVQRMLTLFYLAERRCDFAALQAYRHLVEGDGALPEALLGDLADLFLAEPRADSLALTVYLQTLDTRPGDARLRSAIAACCRTVRSSPFTAGLLARADQALAGIDARQREAMAAQFLPAPSPLRRRRSKPPRQSVRVRLAGRLQRFGHALATWAARAYGLRCILWSAKVKAALKWSFLGLVTVGVGWLVLNTLMHLTADTKPVEKASAPVVEPVTDPFTLQVAAYLKESDARRYVEQLQQQGVEAYWLRASGGGKTWYQVRIAHYKTKAEARAVGEDLKQRQIIGDYYVANYKRPDIP